MYMCTINQSTLSVNKIKDSELVSLWLIYQLYKISIIMKLTWKKHHYWGKLLLMSFSNSFSHNTCNMK